jgi:hypothetical protein
MHGNNSLSMLVNLTFSESAPNKITHKGFALMSEEIQGDLELIIDTSRCSLDMKTCEKISPLSFREICKKVSDKNAFYYSSLESISPPLQCPLKPGNYSIPESSLDLSFISLLSIDGYVWVLSAKLVRIVAGKKTKKSLMCLNMEIKITKNRIKERI